MLGANNIGHGRQGSIGFSDSSSWVRARETPLRTFRTISVGRQQAIQHYHTDTNKNIEKKVETEAARARAGSETATSTEVRRGSRLREVGHRDGHQQGGRPILTAVNASFWSGS